VKGERVGEVVQVAKAKTQVVEAVQRVEVTQVKAPTATKVEVVVEVVGMVQVMKGVRIEVKIETKVVEVAPTATLKVVKAV
jgi:hypothetical protein